MRIAQPHDWTTELPAGIRDEIRARMHTISVGAGETITQTGTPATVVHQIARGYVKMLKDLPSGDQVLQAIYVPGNIFSESAVVIGRDHHHTAVAATPVTLNVISKAEFDELYRKYPQIPEALCRKFAHALSFVLENRESTSLHLVRGQVALLFCNLCVTCAVDGKDGSMEVEVPLTGSDIAYFLGVSRQTVQKEISHLKSEGLVIKQSGRWVIGDLSRLRDYADATR